MLLPVRTLAPAEPLIDIATVKDRLRIEHSEEDTLIADLVAAAEAHLDGYTGVLGRALVTQNWAQSFPSFGARMALPLAPLQSVVSVAYIDLDGTSQVLDASVYLSHTDASGPYLTLAPGQSWPRIQTRDDAVTVTYAAGYGGSFDVPEAIRTAALMIVGALYENRENQMPVQMFEPPVRAQMLYASFRRMTI